MRTFAEMKAAADAHNAKQNPNFLSEIVEKVGFELCAEELAGEFTGHTIGEFEDFVISQGYSRNDAHQITLAHIRNGQAGA